MLHPPQPSSSSSCDPCSSPNAHDPPASNLIWYFAYGSNLTRETFRRHRGISPLAVLPVRVPGWRLVFDVYGLPYSEPAFASIGPIPFSDTTAENPTTEEAHYPSVHGTAYLLDHAAYVSVIASEGGGTAYDEVEVLAVPVTVQEQQEEWEEGQLGLENTTATIKDPFYVTTLVRAYGPTIARCPSRRYKEIICVGAQEAKLPEKYQAYLDQLPCYDGPQRKWRWNWLGSMLFLAWWTPFMTAAEKLTKATANADGAGHCPRWVVSMIRLLLYLMWLYHDSIHAPIWGRGDGLPPDEDCSREGEELTSAASHEEILTRVLV